MSRISPYSGCCLVVRWGSNFLKTINSNTNESVRTSTVDGQLIGGTIESSVCVDYFFLKRAMATACGFYKVYIYMVHE